MLRVYITLFRFMLQRERVRHILLLVLPSALVSVECGVTFYNACLNAPMKVGWITFRTNLNHILMWELGWQIRHNSGWFWVYFRNSVIQSMGHFALCIWCQWTWTKFSCTTKITAYSRHYFDPSRKSSILQSAFCGHPQSLVRIMDSKAQVLSRQNYW